MRPSLTTKFLPPPPLPPMIYILNWIKEQKRDTYIYTYPQTPYGWSQSWNIIHRNGFPIFGVKSRIQTLNSHTFISKITEHKTILIQMLISSITPSQKEGSTQTEKTKCFDRRPHYSVRAYTSIDIRRRLLIQE